jgi:hypothetical protein
MAELPPTSPTAFWFPNISNCGSGGLSYALQGGDKIIWSNAALAPRQTASHEMAIGLYVYLLTWPPPDAYNGMHCVLRSRYQQNPDTKK